MKKTLTLILALGMVCFLAFGSVAAEKKAVKKAETVKINGIVVSIDAAAKTLAIKEKAGDITITVNDKTVIESGKHQKTLADITAGTKVRVKYTVVDAAKIAEKIKIETAKTAAPAK
jgi:PDZ domain-containing secreted protein